MLLFFEKEIAETVFCHPPKYLVAGGQLLKREKNSRHKDRQYECCEKNCEFKAVLVPTGVQSMEESVHNHDPAMKYTLWPDDNVSFRCATVTKLDSVVAPDGHICRLEGKNGSTLVCSNYECGARCANDGTSVPKHRPNNHRKAAVWENIKGTDGVFRGRFLHLTAVIHAYQKVVENGEIAVVFAKTAEQQKKLFKMESRKKDKDEKKESKVLPPGSFQQTVDPATHAVGAPPADSLLDNIPPLLIVHPPPEAPPKSPEGDVSSGSSGGLSIGETDPVFHDGTKEIILCMDIPILIEFCELNGVVIPEICRPQLPENSKGGISENAKYKMLLSITYDFLKKKHGGDFRLKTRLCQECWEKPAEFVEDGCPFHVGLCSTCLGNSCPFCVKLEEFTESKIAEALEDWKVERDKKARGKIFDKKKIVPYRTIYHKGRKVIVSLQTRLMFESVEQFNKLNEGKVDELNQHDVDLIFSLNGLHQNIPLGMLNFDRPLLSMTWQVLSPAQCEKCDDKYEVFRFLKCNHFSHCYKCIEANNLKCHKCGAHISEIGLIIVKHAVLLK